MPTPLPPNPSTAHARVAGHAIDSVLGRSPTGSEPINSANFGVGAWAVGKNRARALLLCYCIARGSWESLCVRLLAV